jgi:YebC/PmpR family DNA-binding regulatory protein
MGRAFEYRKATKLKRWGNMSRVFTRLGKQISIAAKTGADPESNPRLRALIQNAKAENMPKDNIERAIKRAVEKDLSDYKEMVYEGYGPHGIAFLIETTTDNPTRTVANVRSYFNKSGGSLGTSGSVEFMFDHKCVFKIKTKPGIDLDELELSLIDFGVDEVFAIDDEIMIYGLFESFGLIQKYLEENAFDIISGSFDRIPTTELKEISAEQYAELSKLIERFEEDEDVQNVYHNMKEPD